MKIAPTVRIGCAGWSLPRASSAAFPASGTHLERYAGIFNAVEINSSFNRAHRQETYAKWAASVPADFKFSVKLPREISHTLRLSASAKPLKKFLGEIGGLGSRLGCVLIQLPPSFAFDRRRIRYFLALFRRHFGGNAVLEPRHLSWLDTAAEEVLREFDIGRVGSDPAMCAAAAIPTINGRIAYRRLHGSPRMYYSSYDESYLERVAIDLAAPGVRKLERWCIFDNTAHSFATANALRLAELVRGRR